MPDILTPYKSGVFTGDTTGTRLILSGDALASDDVGRILYISNGLGVRQHRLITRVVTITSCDVAHSFTTSNLLGFTDVAPAPGDRWTISYNIADLIGANATLTLSNNNTLAISSMTINATATTEHVVVHARNLNLIFNSGDIEIGRRGAFICGYYGYIEGQDSYNIDSCNITDSANSNGGNQMARGTVTGADFGLFDMYGGQIQVTSANQHFWRTYFPADIAGDATTDCQIRLINVDIQGNFGSRSGGPRSALIVRGVNSASIVGISNPRSSVGRVEMSATNVRQAGYAWLVEGAEGRYIFPQLVDINPTNGRILRVFTQGGGSGRVLEIIARYSEIEAVESNNRPFASAEGPAAANHTLRYGNFINPSIFNTLNEPITEQINVAVRNVRDEPNLSGRGSSSTATTNANIILTDGIYPETFARHSDIVTKTTGSGTQNRFLTTGAFIGTRHGPYTMYATSYLFIKVSRSI